MSKEKRRISVKTPLKDSDFLSYGIMEPELDRFLKSWENWALGILAKGRAEGKYDDLCDLYRRIEENDSRIEERTRHAKWLIDSAVHLRDSIAAKKAEQAAMSMLELISCGLNIYIEEKKESSSNGGKASKKKEGIKLAIEEALKKSKVKTAPGLWRYFKTNHGDKEKALHINSYVIWFYKDSTGPGEDRLYHDDGGEERGITFVTFKRYVAEVKKSLTHH